MPRRLKPFRTICLAAIGMIALAAPSFASDNSVVSEVRFDGGRFEPAQLVVPANAPFKVQVINADKSAIEFESFELHRERVVPPGGSITVLVAPLAPGTYRFFNDFDHNASEGSIVAR